MLIDQSAYTVDIVSLDFSKKRIFTPKGMKVEITYPIFSTEY